MADVHDMRDAHLDVAGYVLGTLTPEEATGFEQHLAGCARCRAELDELSGLPSMLSAASLDAGLPPGLRERTLDAVREAQEKAATPPWGLPPVRPPAPGLDVTQGSRDAPDPAPEAARVPGARRKLGSRSTSRPTAQSGSRPTAATRWLVAAAAALLVAAAVGVGAVLASRDTATTVQLVAADAGSGRGEARVRQVGTGREVTMEVSGLAPNPPGTYYECWFVGAGDSLQTPNRVSAGTFTVGADGTASVVMVSAADPARFPNMGVTLEPDDGNPARTGPKVLGNRS